MYETHDNAQPPQQQRKRQARTKAINIIDSNSHEGWAHHGTNTISPSNTDQQLYDLMKMHADVGKSPTTSDYYKENFKTMPVQSTTAQDVVNRPPPQAVANKQLTQSTDQLQNQPVDKLVINYTSITQKDDKSSRLRSVESVKHESKIKTDLLNQPSGLTIDHKEL